MNQLNKLIDKAYRDGVTNFTYPVDLLSPEDVEATIKELRAKGITVHRDDVFDTLSIHLPALSAPELARRRARSENAVVLMIERTTQKIVEASEEGKIKLTVILRDQYDSEMITKVSQHFTEEGFSVVVHSDAPSGYRMDISWDEPQPASKEA